MQNRFIMTAFGKDRPGIVAEVTKVLYENGCNLEDTTMSMLADEFALNLLFSFTGKDINEQLSAACRQLESNQGISAFVRPLKERQELPQNGLSNYTLHVEGLDQAGIVYKISQFLADHSLNIVDLKSMAKASPESGTDLYLMDIHIQVPAEMTLEQIDQGLTAVAEDLNVDITVLR